MVQIDADHNLRRGFEAQAVDNYAMYAGHILRHEDKWTGRAYYHWTWANDETAWYL